MFFFCHYSHLNQNLKLLYQNLSLFHWHLTHNVWTSAFPCSLEGLAIHTGLFPAPSVRPQVPINHRLLQWPLPKALHWFLLAIFAILYGLAQVNFTSFSSENDTLHEFHETCHYVTFIVEVNSHQRWKQTRFHICFHLRCELTTTMNVTVWQVSWNSCIWRWVDDLLSFLT